jgi:hypothetical protein
MSKKESCAGSTRSSVDIDWASDGKAESAVVVRAFDIQYFNHQIRI